MTKAAGPTRRDTLTLGAAALGAATGTILSAPVIAASPRPIRLGF